MFYAHIPIAVLIPLHAMAACLSVWRITALFTEDRITNKLRTAFPWYAFKCPICFSVWASIAATVLFAFAPWLNWPFALAMVYRWRAESVIKKRIDTTGRMFSCAIRNDGTWEVTRADLERVEVDAILDMVTIRPAVNAPAQPSAAQVTEALQSLSPPPG